MKNIVILISGRGSNMQAIVNARIDRARIVAVISNSAEASGLVWAAEHGLATASLNHRDYASRAEFDQALMALIDAYAPDLVVLAGFMRILTPAFCQHYAHRLMNVHPSLLPAFAGLDTHARALREGCKIAGCTVHFVTAELDHGPIIAQAALSISAEDTEASLAQRILALEHVIYPQAVADFVSGSLTVEHGVVRNRRAAASPHTIVAT